MTDFQLISPSPLSVHVHLQQLPTQICSLNKSVPMAKADKLVILVHLLQELQDLAATAVPV